MTLLASLLERGDPVEERTIRDNQLWKAWASGDDFGGINETPAGVRVTRNSALGLSAVWACVSLIADSIGTLPVDAYVPDGNGARKPYDRPRWLDQPNPEQTRIDWIFNQVASILLDGTAFVYVDRDPNGDVFQTWVLDPNWVQVRREFNEFGQLELVYYVMVARGQESPVGPFRVTASSERIFQINGLQTHSGHPRGVSPLEAARMMYGGAIASQEMGARFFGSGMNASGVLESPMDITDPQAKAVKREFKDANGGFRNWGMPPILTGGLSYKQISISPEQAQFLEHRQFTVDEIARWFRVPPHMIGQLQRTTSWGTGIEYQQITFVTYTLRPYLERMEEAWSRHMMIFDGDARVCFNVNGLLRGDKQAQAQWYAAGRQWGWFNVDDILGDMGQAPLPDGKGQVYLQPVNMAEVGAEEPLSGFTQTGGFLPGPSVTSPNPPAQPPQVNDDLVNE